MFDSFYVTREGDRARIDIVFEPGSQVDTKKGVAILLNASSLEIMISNLELVRGQINSKPLAVLFGHIRDKIARAAKQRALKRLNASQ